MWCVTFHLLFNILTMESLLVYKFIWYFQFSKFSHRLFSFLVNIDLHIVNSSSFSRSLFPWYLIHLSYVHSQVHQQEQWDGEILDLYTLVFSRNSGPTQCILSSLVMFPFLAYIFSTRCAKFAEVFYFGELLRNLVGIYTKELKFLKILLSV